MIVSRLRGVIAGVLVVGLVCAAVTAAVPMTGLEALVMLALLVTACVAVARRAHRRAG
jgi:hypothetical protein